MEGGLVRSPIMEKVELSSAPDGNERGRGGGGVWQHCLPCCIIRTEREPENRHPLSLPTKGLVWVARN